MIISFSVSVTGINTLLSKKFANDLSPENLLDRVLNYTEFIQVSQIYVKAHKYTFNISKQILKKETSGLFMYVKYWYK